MASSLEGITPLDAARGGLGVEHLIRVSLVGHLDEAASVKVEPGATEAVKLTLKALAPSATEAAVAHSVADPRGKKDKKERRARWRSPARRPRTSSSGGKKLGHTPATVKLPAGQGDADVRQHGAGSAPDDLGEVEARPRAKTRSAIEFKKGKIAADAKPWADVYIGERKLGTTPLAPREVYEGSYTLRLVNSELGAIKAVKVVVEPGRTTVVREQLE